jgi:type 1 glutamine amidotransferase
MIVTRRKFTQGSLALIASTQAGFARTSKKLKILVVDGINNHTWKVATAGIREILTNTALFTVDMSTTPPVDADSSAWDGWRPDFFKYDAVINNFNSGFNAKSILWPQPVRDALEKYVSGGGGLVSYHAANNAFLMWPEYNQMIGMGWRPKSYGPSVHIGDHDEVIVMPKGEGFEPNHPPRLDFQVHVRDTHHPITHGMPRVWLHPSEQLTHGQHGPVQGFTFLTYAHSPVTKQNEPMDWVHTYGKGRVYTTMLGHTWINEPSPDLDCVGFQTLLARGVQWVATGHVTIPISKDFPGPDHISLRPLKSLDEVS